MAPCHGPETLLTRVFAEPGHFEQTVRCYETLTATALDMDLDARDLGIRRPCGQRREGSEGGRAWIRPNTVFIAPTCRTHGTVSPLE
jgi:hypothetical protein